MEKAAKRVLVGLSGGVDSSVAAALLQKRGFLVEAGFMKNWSLPVSRKNDGCAWQEDYADAKKVAEFLKIRLHFFDFEKEYQKEVIGPFFRDYREGKTPNPDVLCNKMIKFGLFLEAAKGLGFDWLATGHYARVEKIDNGRLGRGKRALRGKDRNKDQSYFLATLTAEQLTDVIFPIGDYQKFEVRTIAEGLKLPTAKKKDSQGICFVGKVDLPDFLKTRLPIKTGAVRSLEDGRIVGWHEGVWFYTEGQHRGIGLVGGGIPYYVVEKDIEKNILWVAPGNDHGALFSRRMVVEKAKFNSLAASSLLNSGLSCQIRYRHPASPCRIKPIGADDYLVDFEVRERSITPGQIAAFYLDDRLVGGGVIARSQDKNYSLPAVDRTLDLKASTV